MNRITLLAGAFALAGTGSFAATVDFENEVPLNPDPTLIAVGNTYTNGGITFSSTEVMQLVGVGPDRDGFVPNDTPGSTASGPADFGQVFLTGDFDKNTDMTLSFAQSTFMAFEIVDIDGGNDNIVEDANEEKFVFSFKNAGVLQSAITVTSRDLVGPVLNEAGVVTVSYGGLFDSVEIVGTTPGGTRNIGWGIDNIVFTPSGNVNVVPVPAAGLMLLTALGGIGLMRRRKRAS